MKLMAGLDSPLGLRDPFTPDFHTADEAAKKSEPVGSPLLVLLKRCRPVRAVLYILG